MKTNVLITSASRKVNLVKAFQQALKMEGGGKVIAVDIGPLSAALYCSDVAYLVPRSSEERFVPTIIKLCKHEAITVVVPTRDEELLLFAENKKNFEEFGTMVMVADPTVIRICIDKLNFLEFCRDHSFPVPATFSLNHISQNSFPLFVRDRFGKGSKKAFKVRNQHELDLILTLVEEPIIQEYIEGTEYTVDVFADFNGNIISAVPRERIHVFGGESFISRTYKNETLIHDACKLATTLHLIGHNTIQCFFDDEKTQFIEVNPRYGGGAHLGFAAGANTPLFLIQLLKNKQVKPRIGDFSDHYVMLRYTEDIFIDESITHQVNTFD